MVISQELLLIEPPVQVGHFIGEQLKQRTSRLYRSDFSSVLPCLTNWNDTFVSFQLLFGTPPAHKLERYNCMFPIFRLMPQSASPVRVPIRVTFAACLPPSLSPFSCQSTVLSIKAKKPKNKS